MFYDNRLTLQQKQTITMKQIQSLDMLACTNQEMELLLRDEFLINPMLDYTMDKRNNSIINMDSMNEKRNRYEDYSLNEEEESYSINNLSIKSKRSIKEELKEQLCLKKYNKKQQEILMLLIEYLEEDGYFTYDVLSFAHDFQMELSEVEYCLCELKELEPAGIFSKNLAECLIIQLHRKNLFDKNLELLINTYMEELLKGNINKISKQMKVTSDKMKEYLKVISNLNPRPIYDIADENIEYVIPDIIVTNKDGNWEILINDGWIGEYKYNDYYIKVMNETKDEELRQYFSKNYERAKFIITCVEQRRNTLKRVMEAILSIQSDYFLNNGKLKAMSLQHIADMIKVHPSTVSRSIKGKYVQHKRTILIKELFLYSLNESEGEGISTDSIKATIKEMIESEGERTLSDNQIAEHINKRGINISRRTVAKYRQEMNILDSNQRKYLK